MKKPIDDQVLEQCFHRVTDIFDLPLDFEHSRRHLEDCLELADNMETVEKAAQECKKAGKASIPALKKYLRTHRKNDESTDFCIEADGQFSIRIENHTSEEVVEDEKKSSTPKTKAVVSTAAIPRISIEEAFAPYFDTLYDYQNLLIDDLKQFGTDPLSRLTIFNPPTSIGKTYMIPAIAFLAHQNGCKLVYSCSTRTSIREVHKEFITGTLRQYYMNPDPETGCKKLLLIPSIKDSYINFLKSVLRKPENLMDNPDDATYLPVCTQKDVDDLMSFLKKYDKANNKSRGVNALDNIPKALDALGDEHSLPQGYKEAMEQTFNSLASDIRSILHHTYLSILDQCKNHDAAVDQAELQLLAKKKMLIKYPWVGKLYPGFLFDFAEVILVTNRKLTVAIDPIGISRGSMVAPTMNADKNYWILVDEVDQFCSDLLSEPIDRAMRVYTDLKELLCMIGAHSLTAILQYDKETPDRSVLIADPSMLPDKEERKEKLRKQIIDLRQEIDAFDEKYSHCLTQNRAMWYDFDTDADGSMIVPTLAVDKTTVRLIMPESKKKKQKDREVETTTRLILRNSDSDNRLRILQKEIPLGEENTVEEPLYTEWCREASLCLHHFLIIVRQLCNSKEEKSPELRQELAREFVCERLGLRGVQGRYIRENILQHWSTSVSWDHFYAYGITWNLMDTHNPMQTEINIESCNGFPDFLFANLVLNSKKAILCSATAGMKSLPMPDVHYTLNALAKHADDERAMNQEREKGKMEETNGQQDMFDGTDDNTVVHPNAEIAPTDPNTFLYVMKSIPKASAMLQEKRSKEYDHVDLVFEQYDRVPKNPNKHPKALLDCLADVERYEEMTGIPLCEADQKDFSIRNLAFACFAIESMLKNKLHTAIVYATRLPRSGIDPDVCYTMPRCEQAKEAILARLGLKGIHFTIKRMDANSEKTIVRDPDEYVLVLSAYSSTGAGSNITVQTRSENGSVTTPVDLAGVYCDNVTNIIPGPQSSDERNVRIRCAMEIAYLVRKSAELMAQQYEGDSLRQNGCFNTAMLALYYAHPGGRSILGTCLTPGLAGVFTKDIFVDEPFSPLKETQRKTVLQAVNRIERGHVGEDRILLCMSDTLIKNAGISEEAYRNTAYPGHLFGYALKQIAAQAKPDVPFKDQDELERLNRCYMDANIHNRKTIDHIMDQIGRSKEAGGVNPELAARYERLRKVAFSCGYGDNPDIRVLFHHAAEPGLTNRYAVQKGSGEKSREQIDKARLYPIEEAASPCDVRCRPNHMGPYGALQYHAERKWLGNGWQTYFAEVLPFMDEIMEHGYKYLPYANMHDVNIGMIYERMFLAASCTGGAYDIGYPVVPYDEELLEDFDFRYAGTHVVIDIKGYAVGRKPTTPDKITQKIKRYQAKYGRKPVVLFINMMSGDGVNSRFEPHRYFTYINGFSDTAKTDLDNELIFADRRNALRALCDANRIKK